MKNQVILKISNNYSKVVETKTDVNFIQHFLPFGCEINIQEFFKNI